MTKGLPQSHLRLSQSLTTLAMATFAFSSSLDAISINCSVLSTRERACSAKFPVSPMVLRIFCKRLIWLNKVLFTLWRRSIRFWSTSAIAVQKEVHKWSEAGEHIISHGLWGTASHHTSKYSIILTSFQEPSAELVSPHCAQQYHHCYIQPWSPIVFNWRWTHHLSHLKTSPSVLTPHSIPVLYNDWPREDTQNKI